MFKFKIFWKIVIMSFKPNVKSLWNKVTVATWKSFSRFLCNKYLSSIRSIHLPGSSKKTLHITNAKLVQVAIIEEKIFKK